MQTSSFQRASFCVAITFESEASLAAAARFEWIRIEKGCEADGLRAHAGTPVVSLAGENS